MKFDHTADTDGDWELLPKGTYSATVTKAAEKTSKSGHEMIELGLCVYADDGSERYVWDYLLSHAMLHRIKHFCEATGMEGLWESDELTAADCEGKDVTVKVDIEPAKNNYKAKNKVVDYVAASGKAAAAPAQAQAQPPGDHKPVEESDIPF